MEKLQAEVIEEVFKKLQPQIKLPPLEEAVEKAIALGVPPEKTLGAVERLAVTDQYRAVPPQRCDSRPICRRGGLADCGDGVQL